MAGRRVHRWFLVLLCMGCGAAAWGQENQLLNCEFDEGLTSWARYGTTGYDWSVVQGAHLSGQNALLLDVTNPAATTSIGAAQGGLQFENSKTYPIGVTAKADKEREMVILIQLYKPEGPTWVDIFLQRVQLTTTAQTFVFDFTYMDDTMTSHPAWEADIYFMLKGAWWSMAGDGLVSKVWIDRVHVGEQPPLMDSTMLTVTAPDPTDGAVIDPTVPTLKWKAGDWAVTHQVYFSDDLAAVQGGQVEPVSTTQPSLTVGAAAPYPTGLTPGTLYYWRVDEVNDVESGSPWPGPVWNFLVRPTTAWRPDPPDGARFIEADRTLTWQASTKIMFHKIYFGSSMDALGPAAPVSGMSLETEFDPGPLQPGTTYYWRVDEMQQTGMTVAGKVWQFTTAAEAGGLQAEYFTNADLAGEPALTRIDPQINFDWGNGSEAGTYSPDPGIPGDGFSARWTGELEVDLTDTYVFSITANNGFRLWLEGRLIIDFWDNPTTDSRRSAPIPLTAGKTYSLRMDYYEGTGAALAQLFWESAVQNQTSARIPQLVPAGAFQLPVKAHSPQPANGAVDTVWSLDLTWVAGSRAVEHQVYFGDDAQAVADANTTTAGIYQGTQADTTFTVNDLEWGRTYYWRVDEVNEADPAGLWPGTVWEFTTADFIPVDDFESYNDEEDQGTRIYETWLDGWFDDSSGSQVGYTDPPFAEQTIVHGGDQSMPVHYDNSKSPFYSQIERAFAPVENWTGHNLSTLVLYIRGRATNAPASLFVALEDQAGHRTFVQHADSAPVTGIQWAEWRVPLSDFTGVNPAQVKKLYLRLGDPAQPTPGGTGLLYVDDIRVVAAPGGQ
jgi:hypothetical protein